MPRSGRTPQRCETAVGPVDAVWHFLNFFAPALGVAVIGALLAKVLLRQTFAGVGWPRLLAWAAGAGIAASIGGLAVFARDGRIETYAAMVLAVAFGLAAAAWRAR